MERPGAESSDLSYGWRNPTNGSYSQSVSKQPSGDYKRNSHDISNVHHSPAQKKARTEQSAFLDLLKEAGCSGFVYDSDDDAASDTIKVRDVKKLRHMLETRLRDAALTSRFLAGMETVMRTAEVLHRALMPMEVSQEQAAQSSGDSFIRMALSIDVLQPTLCRNLLEKLPEYGIANKEPERSIPSLIIGQLRWLELVSDGQMLVDQVLQVICVCPDQVKCQLIGFLPEIAAEGDHERVLRQLMELVQEHDQAFVAPVLEALSSMQMCRELQEECIEGMLGQLASAEVEDLPAIIRFVVTSSQNCGKDSVRKVVGALRSQLHFVQARDPRFALPDTKQKAPAGGSSSTESAEVQTAKELCVSLQLHELAADALLKEIQDASEPGQLRTVDLWAMVALHPSRSKQVEALLKKKVAEGVATVAWLSRCTVGHVGALTEQWSSLMTLVQHCSCAAEGGGGGKGAKQVAPAASMADFLASFYVILFKVFDQGHFHRQEVLHMLHTHLGSGQRREVEIAMSTLSQLALNNTAELSQYGAYLGNILDHLESFSDQDLKQVFHILTLLTSDAGASRDGEGSSTSAAGMKGGRLEDEIFIVVDKALAHPCPSFKRIGIIGSCAIMRQLTAVHLNVRDENPPALGKWQQRVDSLFRQCGHHADCHAFMMDQLSELLHDVGDQLPAAALELLRGKMEVLFEGTFTSDTDSCPPEVHVPGIGTAIGCRTWMNLDSGSDIICINIWPLLASEEPTERASMRWMAASLRLLAAATIASLQNLDEISGLLGSPLAMPSVSVFGPVGCEGVSILHLPHAAVKLLLQAFQQAISWTREVVNVFSTQISSDQDGMMKQKLVFRCAQLFQLETVFFTLLSTWEGSSAALLSLPNLARPSLKSATARDGGSALVDKDGTAECSVLSTKAPTAAQITSQLRQKLRPLTPSAYSLLSRLSAATPSVNSASVHSEPDAEETERTVNFAELSAATYLAVGLQSRLASVIAARRGSCFGHATIDLAVASLTVESIIAEIQPLLPSLRRNLDAASSLARGTAQALLSDLELDTIYSGDKESLFSSLHLARPATQPLLVASKYISTCLSLFQMLFTNRDDHPPDFMADLLSQLAAPASAAAAQPGVAGPSAPSLDSFTSAFNYLSSLSTLARGYEGKKSFRLDLQLLKALLALVDGADAALASISGPNVAPGVRASTSKTCVSLHNNLSIAAGVMLEIDWSSGSSEVDNNAAADVKAFTWRGQGEAISELLQVYITHNSNPTDTLLHLATVVLQEVPAKVSSKNALDPVANYYSLCDATLCAWFKAVMDALLLSLKSLKSKVTKSFKTEGSLTAEEEEELVGSSQSCAKAFAGILNLSRVHGKKTAILSSCVKNGAAFVDTVLELLPVWKSIYNRYQSEFDALVKDVQKGTKIMQTLCAEGKARSAPSLTCKVPAAKKSMEKFIFEIKSFLTSAGRGDAFWVGNLKHRDLQGKAVASQYPRDDQDDDQEEEEEEEEEAEEGG